MCGRLNEEIGLLAACVCLLTLAACDEASDAKSEADVKSGSAKITSSQGQVDSTVESIEMNVMFTYPDGQEDKIGQTVGLSSCKTAALPHLMEKKLIMAEGWSYTCCTIEEGLQCHRNLR
jgi:hypothetical protein